MFITVSLPPISGMGKGLKEHEGDLLIVGKIMDKEVCIACGYFHEGCIACVS
jgi:hypothetical protein